MIDLLNSAYPWIKAFHIISVISWMAGIFYLPRLFVHHSESIPFHSDAHDVFCTMEEKLLRVIMNPAMIATWVFGLLLVATPGIVDWSDIWPWLKAGSVLGMTVFHMWLAGQRKRFKAQGPVLTGKAYRMMNEVPTALMFVIVISVVVKF